ncbi:MAG TPA: outer membrane beta-barrel protein, partial [Cytophagaceae bacterium]
NVNYFKSRLSATYIDVPLEVRFKSSQNNKKAFHLAFGAKIGFLINSKTKYKFEENNVKTTQKQISNMYLNPIRYGLSARIGYGLFQLFGYYSLNPLFQDKKAFDVTPVMFGITFASL